MGLDLRPSRRWLQTVALAGTAIAGIGLAASDADARDGEPVARPAAIAHTEVVRADIIRPDVVGAVPRRNADADRLIDAAACTYLAAAGSIALGAGLARRRPKRPRHPSRV